MLDALKRIYDEPILLRGIYTDSLHQTPREAVFNEELGLLAFLALPPVPSLNGVPINFAEIVQIAAILEEVRSCIRQRECPALVILLCPPDRRLKIGL